jgi:hypothetical protein
LAVFLSQLKLLLEFEIACRYKKITSPLKNIFYFETVTNDPYRLGVYRSQILETKKRKHSITSTLG